MNLDNNDYRVENIPYSMFVYSLYNELGDIKYWNNIGYMFPRL